MCREKKHTTRLLTGIWLLLLLLWCCRCRRQKPHFLCIRVGKHILGKIAHYSLIEWGSKKWDQTAEKSKHKNKNKSGSVFNIFNGISLNALKIVGMWSSYTYTQTCCYTFACASIETMLKFQLDLFYSILSYFLFRGTFYLCKWEQEEEITTHIQMKCAMKKKIEAYEIAIASWIHIKVAS